MNDDYYDSLCSDRPPFRQFGSRPQVQFARDPASEERELGLRAMADMYEDAPFNGYWDD